MRPICNKKAASGQPVLCGKPDRPCGAFLFISRRTAENRAQCALCNQPAGRRPAKPAGLPVWLSMLLNCAATIINLGLPIAVLFSWVKPLGLPALRITKPVAKLAGIWLPLFLCFTSLGSAVSNLVRLLLGFGGYTPPAVLQLPTSSGALLLAFCRCVCCLPCWRKCCFAGSSSVRCRLMVPGFLL